MGRSSNGDTQTLREKPIKRAFCAKCEKAQGVCICKRFKGIVQNKVRITILQNPKEKQHAVGSARVALLGLENVDSVTVPELYTAETFRIRPKVPGSKRCLSGRGGKKLLLNGKIPVSVHDNRLSDVELVQVRDLLNQIFKQQLDSDNDLELLMRASPSLKNEPSFLDGSIERFNSPNGEECMVSEDEFSNRHLHVASNGIDSGLLCLQDLEALIPPGVGLLFPSEKAIELSDLPLNGENHESQVPSHLLVLDGTWSKAKRIYFENPWLKTIPHFKLSPSSPSLYEGVRKQPKSGYLSTLESIIYALKILEPDIIEGLDNLLEVFNSMLDDQRLYKQLKHLPRDH
ncbi:hypothetical protein KP509_33G029200 [Ceratopteris richardii]|nr:hypothetical protein KP509_33G029200 [Ceratopteris richardii]